SWAKEGVAKAMERPSARRARRIMKTPAELTRWNPNWSAGTRPVADDGHCTNASTRVEGKWFPCPLGDGGGRHPLPHKRIVSYHIPMTESQPNPDWRPLALMLAGFTAAYAVVYRLMPYDMSAFF